MALENRRRLPDHIRGYLRNFFPYEVTLFRRFWLPPSRAAEALTLPFENLK